VNPQNIQQTQGKNQEGAKQGVQIRRLLTFAALLHILIVILIVVIGNSNWIPGLFTDQGIGTFNIDNLPYIDAVESLVKSIQQYGWGIFLNHPAELHIKLYTLSFAILSPMVGFTVAAGEITNLFYYMAVLIIIYYLGKHVFNHQVGMVAAMIVSLWPSFIIHSTQLLKTPLLVACTLVFLMANVLMFQKYRSIWRKIVVLGFYLASAVTLLLLFENSRRKPLIIAIIVIGLLGLGLHQIFLLRPKIRLAVGMGVSVLGVLLAIFVLLPFLAGFDGNNQQYSTLDIPGNVERVLQQGDFSAAQIGVMRGRFATLYPDAGSNIDTEYQIDDLDDLIQYLPRAASIGFFAPFPNMWFEQGVIGVSPRVLSGVETLIMYAVLAIAVIGIWRARQKVYSWYLVSVAVISLVMLGVIVMNVGALFRMRYPFWMILIIYGAAGYYHYVLPGVRVLWGNFSGGVKQIIMSDFSVYSPILLVANWDWVLYNFRLPLARELEKHGQHVILVCPPGRYTEKIQAEGLKWQPWNLNRRSIYPWQEFSSVLELYKIYRDLRPVAVHHFTIKPILYGSLAASFAQVDTVINNFTGLGYLFSDARKALWLRRLILPILKRALHGMGFHTAFQNEQDRSHLVNLGVVKREDTTIIPGTGVDLANYQPVGTAAISKDELVVFMAARLLWDKGLRVFVDAARRIKAMGIRARFLLAGEPDPGNLASVSDETLEDWRSEGVVELLGHRSDIPELLQYADVAVLPSHHEGVPLFLLEAAATGLPLVATDIEGCRMVIEEGRNGFLVRRDDIEEFTDKLKTLLLNPELRTQMGRESRRVAEERFDQRSILGQYMQLYRKLNVLHGASAKSMPVLLVANWDWVLYNFRLPLARKLEQQGLNVILVCPPGKYTDQLQDMGFTWQPWNLNRRSIYPWHEVGSIIELYKLYRQLRPAAVHHFTIKPILYGSLAARAAHGTVVINNFTGLGYLFSEAQKAKILRSIVLPVLRRALRGEGFHTAFQNQHDLDHLVSLDVVSEADTTLIPGTGVNISDYQPVPKVNESKKEPIVIMAARLLWDKGLAEFVNAARKIRSKQIPARFWLAGAPDKGNPDSVPEYILEDWRKEGKVELLGHRNDIPDLLKQSDIAVLPSRYNEGVPLFLLEAAATGLPLVASDIEGCRMVIDSDVNGFLVPDVNADNLADAITTLLTDVQLRQKMGRASREIAVERFDQNLILSRYINLYQEMGLLLR